MRSLARTAGGTHVPNVTSRVHDFRHSRSCQGVTYNRLVRSSRWLKVAAIGTWAVCGLPSLATIVTGTAGASTAAYWATAFAAYGAALITALEWRGSAPRLAGRLAAVQTVAAVVVAWLNAHYLDGSGVGLIAGIGLMVVIAAQLPHLVHSTTVFGWIVAQTLALTVVVSGGIGFADLATFGLGAAGFQAFASMTTTLMLREAAARADLARVNAELHATRALLAENSRAAERLRIARDLHDALGHHLTALSLQLDVASRLADARGQDAADHVRHAHAITRLLLADIRSVVGELRDQGQIDLAAAVRAHIASTASLDIHLDMPEHLPLDDSAQAQSLLRCIQEIVTNTARHANARNLWIRLEPSADGIALSARDDGRGVEIVRCGNGLQGMRERFAQYCGRVEFAARAGEGFEVHGHMPVAPARS